MKKSILIVLFVLLQSCNYSDVKKISKDRIVEEQLKTFNWNNVDTYPSFKACDNLTVKEDKRACFESEIANHLFNALNKETIIVSDDVNETIYLELLINQKGMVSIKNKEISEKTRLLIPNIDSFITKGINSLPKIYPAIKRGQQVQTQFILPINLKMNSL
jgi:hypothetical protein